MCALLTNDSSRFSPGVSSSHSNPVIACRKSSTSVASTLFHVRGDFARCLVEVADVEPSDTAARGYGVDRVARFAERHADIVVEAPFAAGHDLVGSEAIEFFRRRQERDGAGLDGVAR